MTKQLTPTINFGGGLNLNADPTLIGDNEATEMVNMVSTRPGEIRKRYGITRYNGRTIIAPSANFEVTYPNKNYLKSMYRSYKADGTINLLAHAGTDIRIGIDPTYSATGRFNAGKTGCNAASMFTYETMNNTVILASINEVLTYDFGTTFAALGGTPPLANFCRVHKNYLFLGNVTYSGGTYTSRIYYSAVGLPTTWGANSYINIKTEDGDRITGLVSMNGILYVFKERSIHAVTGDIFDPVNGDMAVTQVSDTIGCKYPKSLCVTPYGIVFVAHDGVRVFNGSSSTLISDKIKPIADTIVSDPAIYPAYGGASGGYDSVNGWYYLSYRDMSRASSATNPEGSYTRCVIFDFKLNNWYKLDNINAACFCSFNGVGDDNSLWFGSAYEGTVYKLNNNATNDDDVDEISIVNFEATETWTGAGVTQHANATFTVDTAKIGTQGLVLTSGGVGTISAILDLTGAGVIPLNVSSYPRTGKDIDTLQSLVTGTLRGADFLQFSFYPSTWTNVTSLQFKITLDYLYGTPGTQMVVWTSSAYTEAGGIITAGAWNTVQLAFESGVVTGVNTAINLHKVNGVKVEMIQVGTGTPVVWVSDVRFVSANPEPIKSVFKTKYFDFGKPELQKNFKELYLNTPVRDMEVSVNAQSSNDERNKILDLRVNATNDYIYYAGGTSVYKALKTTGGSATAMCTGARSGYTRRCVCVDDNNIYCDESNGSVAIPGITYIQKYDKDGLFLSETSISGTESVPRYMEIDNEYIYYSATLSGNIHVTIIRKEDMSVIMMRLVENLEAYYGIASDKDILILGRDLYKPYNSFEAVSGGGYGNLQFIRSIHAGNVAGYLTVDMVCIDDNYIYIQDSTVSVWKIDRKDYKVVDYVSGQVLFGGNPGAICVDHEYLYLFTNSNSKVYRYRKSSLTLVDNYTLSSAVTGTAGTRTITVSNTAYKSGIKEKPLAYTIWSTGSKIAFKFENSTLGDPVVLTGMSMTYAPKVIR